MSQFLIPPNAAKQNFGQLLTVTTAVDVYATANPAAGGRAEALATCRLLPITGAAPRAITARTPFDPAAAQIHQGFGVAAVAGRETFVQPIHGSNVWSRHEMAV